MFASKPAYKKVESYLSGMEGSRLIVPFASTSADGLLSLRNRKFEFVWINDTDAALASMWRSALVHPRKLVKKIERYQPNQYDNAYFSAELSQIKRIPADIEEITDVALKKLVLLNNGKWNPVTLARYVRSANYILKRQSCRFTSWDFETLFRDHTDEDIIYIESPNISKSDMWRLSESLYCFKNWILITSDESRIFFNWANIEDNKDQLVIRPYFD